MDEDLLDRVDFEIERYGLDVNQALDKLGIHGLTRKFVLESYEGN